MGDRRSRLATTLRKAFSLFELVIVLAIIGVLSAIALPRFSRSLARYRVDMSARRVVADLDYARSQAMSTSNPRSVSFSVGADAYALIGEADLDHPGQPYVIELAADPYRTSITSAVFDDAVDIADDTNVVIFDPYGMPDSNGEVVVTSGGVTMTVVLDPDTGRAAVQ